MKKISLLLSMLAFVSFVAITPVSAGKPATTKKAPTAQTTPAPAAKKACCADAKKGKCCMGKDGKTCPEMEKTATPAPKAK
jgi:D-alanyl-D-alanine carboxypeptidase